MSYSVATQTPQHRIASLQGLGTIPVTGASGARPQLLEGLTTLMRRGAGMAVVSHYNVQPTIDIFGAVQGRDLGAVSREMAPILDAAREQLPRGSQLMVRGQIETMRTSFSGLLAGLAFAIVLVYLLIVVNFQSWLDPFIIVSALPAALAGIIWMLFVTGTTISVPALTGAIMCVGVATANSILVVSFAKDEVARGLPAIDAARDAAFMRFRPVIMTAAAMIIGMIPMALGLGEGGEQNAPLGRAVVGGLALATVATLFFVPAVFVLLHRWRVGRPRHRDRPKRPRCRIPARRQGHEREGSRARIAPVHGGCAGGGRHCRRLRRAGLARHLRPHPRDDRTHARNGRDGRAQCGGGAPETGRAAGRHQSCPARFSRSPRRPSTPGRAAT